MRKILILFILIITSAVSFAQFSTVQFSPATFTGDDEVTFTIDLSGTPLEGESDVYIWIFANDGSANTQYPFAGGIATNTEWTNSPVAAQFTNVSGNIWSYTFTGTELFGLTPGQLKYFQFLGKTKTGNKQTTNSPQYTFAPISYVPATYRLFPSRMNQDDAVTIFFYQNLSSELIESRMTPVSVTVTMYDNDNNSYGSPIEFPVEALGGKLFKFKSFIPSYSWNVSQGVILSRFTYYVNGNYFDVNGATIVVSAPLNSRTFDVLQ